MKWPFLTTRCQYKCEIAIPIPLDVSINVKCHSWPLDVSRNVKLPLLTTSCQSQCEICLLYIYICIGVYIAIKLIQYTGMQVIYTWKRGRGSSACFIYALFKISKENWIGVINWKGGVICLWYLYPYIYWYFLIFSYKLTVSNVFSLATLKSIEFT